MKRSANALTVAKKIIFQIQKKFHALDV